MCETNADLSIVSTGGPRTMDYESEAGTILNQGIYTSRADCAGSDIEPAQEEKCTLNSAP